MKHILIVTLLLSSLLSNADNLHTTIKGTNIEYAGQVIKVYKFIDYITKKQELLAIDTVNSQGNFSLTYTQNETLLISSTLGIYNSIIFTQPGKTYNVILPPFQPKTKADILNPFHKQIEIYLGIKNLDSLDINFQIAEFNNTYRKFIDENPNIIYKKPNAENVDSVIKVIERIYSDTQNDFFNDYRKYKYASLKYSTYMRDDRYVIREYYHNNPFLYQNPAYMDLFNQLFANYLSNYMKTSEGERIYSDIAYAKSPMYAKETFTNNMVLLNDTLQELVLLKGLHDSFINKDFPVSSMIITLDSISYSTKIDYHKTIAKNIKQKVLKAKQGFDAPKFKLTDSTGKIQDSDSIFTTFVYLNFISIESFTCIQDLELLKKMHEKHKEDFNIVSVCIDDDFEKTADYFKEKEYNWTLLNYSSQKSIIDDYKVKVYPMYYLINPKGKLRLSPAVSPGENFEWHFYKILQSLKKSERN